STSWASGIDPFGNTSCPAAVTASVRVSASGIAKSVSPVAAPCSSPALSTTYSVPAASRSKPPSELKPVAMVVGAPFSRRTICRVPAPKSPCPTRMALPRRTTAPWTVPGVGMVCTAHPESATTAAPAGPPISRPRTAAIARLMSALLSLDGDGEAVDVGGPVPADLAAERPHAHGGAATRQRHGERLRRARRERPHRRGEVLSAHLHAHAFRHDLRGHHDHHGRGARAGRKLGRARDRRDPLEQQVAGAVVPAA